MWIKLGDKIRPFQYLPFCPCYMTAGKCPEGPWGSPWPRFLTVISSYWMMACPAAGSSCRPGSMTRSDREGAGAEAARDADGAGKDSWWWLAAPTTQLKRRLWGGLIVAPDTCTGRIFATFDTSGGRAWTSWRGYRILVSINLLD